MREQQYFVILATVAVLLALGGAIQQVKFHVEKPLSGIDIYKTIFDLNEKKAHVKASPTLLGSNVIKEAILSSFLVCARSGLMKKKNKLQCNFYFILTGST